MESHMSETTESTSTAQNAPTTPPVVVVDLGKQKRSRIKKLRKGDGPLMERVHGVIDELRVGGTVGDNAQPVVIVVREKEKLPFPLSGLVR
jgi:Family of unknown function (DUF6200)